MFFEIKHTPLSTSAPTLAYIHRQTQKPYHRMSASSTTHYALDLWSNPKRHNGVTAKHDSVEQVFGNATTLGMILGYLESDHPLTNFELNMAHKLGWFKGRYNPTEVCWHWYANWFPNGFSKYQWPLSLSYTSEDDVRIMSCTHEKLWNRLQALCRSLRLSPLEVAHLPHGGMGEARSSTEGLQMGLFAKLHTIYVEHASAHHPWLQQFTVAGTHLTTKLLTHLEHFPHVRQLKIFVNTNQQVRLLSHMTQLEVLDLEVDDDITRHEEEVYLSPLCTLTRLRYLFLHNYASGYDFASFVSSLCNLEVLQIQEIQSCEVYKDNVWVSMRELTALRRFSLRSGSTNINLLKSLLTLPHSDVDIHLPIESIAELNTTQTPKQRQAYCEALRKLMRRFGLGLRSQSATTFITFASRRSQSATTFTTFASRRWPARCGDVRNPHMVDQYAQRLCGYGVTCSRCREKGWYKGCENCLSCDSLYLEKYLTKFERRKRRRLGRGPPKGIRTAYMLWCEDNRASVEKDHPSFKLTDVARYLGNQWKTVADDVKRDYQRKSESDKVRYARENEEYTQKYA